MSNSNKQQHNTNIAEVHVQNPINNHHRLGQIVRKHKNSNNYLSLNPAQRPISSFLPAAPEPTYTTIFRCIQRPSSELCNFNMK
ncbi:unnamed protein product [Adineta steineri]|uniref:Uncharacterized protein n=1 Tax=Adineta steineri TaxID=433720 RepID=A0A815NXR0_9BILA|nr:unnamed protein product [Adineta steineri]CAF1627857.1 unnamed protein product [Adineta steineri]